MEERTRNLLQLLAREDVDQLLRRLADGATNEKALAAALGVSQPTANRRLRELVPWGIVGSEQPTETDHDRPGPAGRLWSLMDPETVEFGNQADAFALALHDRAGRRLREVIAGRRRGDLRLADEEGRSGLAGATP